MINHQFDYNKTREHFDELAKTHPDMVGMYVFPSRWNPQFRAFFEERVISELLTNHLFKLNKNMTVLDLGCGGGRWCVYFAERCGHVIGVDISPSSLKIAEEYARLNNQGGKIQFVCSSIPDFLPTQKLDLVFIGGVANYLSDESLSTTLDALSSHMGDDAVFIIRDSIANKGHEIDRGYFTRYRTLDEFETVMGHRGFKLIGRRSAFPEKVARLDFRGVEDLLSILEGSEYVNNYFSALYEEITSSPEPETPWHEGEYQYWHDFMIFRRDECKI